MLLIIGQHVPFPALLVAGYLFRLVYILWNARPNEYYPQERQEELPIVQDRFEAKNKLIEHQ